MKSYSTEMKRIPVPEEVLEVFFGQDGHQLELISVARFGSSGPRVVILKDNSITYALKYGETRVPISTQMKNREILAKYIPCRLPRIERYGKYKGGEAMLMEAVDGPNLHEAVMLGSIPDGGAIKIVQSILYDFTAMWDATRGKCGVLTRDPTDRAQRIITAVSSALEQLGVERYDHLIVNGQDVGILEKLLPKLLSYKHPQYSVLCHSDLNGDNFVLASGNTSWFIVDWEWVGRHDWKLSLSHLIGWWHSNATKLKGEPVIKRTGRPNRVEIIYDLTMPEVVTPIENLCLQHGEEIARVTDEQDWRNQLRLLIATLLLGDLRFVETRGRKEYKLPLIGEGLRLLHERMSD